MPTGLRQGYDIILVARGRTGTAAWKDLNDTFLRLCRKLDLLEERPEADFGCPGEVLPCGHFSLPAALLQLYAYLFPVCSGGH